MQKICKTCNQNFEITDDDLIFLEKISPVFNITQESLHLKIPAPTLCPDCRMQRRLSWRNERHLYMRKCDLCEKSSVMLYSPDKKYTVYCRNCWWSDKWDPLNYGKDYNFNKSFFEQFENLLQKTPLLGLWNVHDENAEYNNNSFYLKNSYMNFNSDKSDRIFYGYGVENCIDCIDCTFTHDSELCYECIDSENIYQCLFSQNLKNSNECYFSTDLIGCSKCFACHGLRNKEYFIFNEKVTKEIFEEKTKNLIFTHNLINDFKKQSQNLYLKIPKRFAQIINSENCTGDQIRNYKNAITCFDCTGGENIKNVTYGAFDVNNTEDAYAAGSINFAYEFLGGGFGINNVAFTINPANGLSNSYYTIQCANNSANLFGSIGLKHKEYCILNKQYSKKEYEKLVPKIIEAMKSPKSPLTRGLGHPLDKGGLGDCEWGEFFPSSISPFAYNETLAQEYFPLTKEQALSKDFKWSDYEPEFPHVEKTIPANLLPDSINDIPDDILNWAIECEISKKPFKIIKPELDFYRKMNLPIPRRHTDQRHKDRMALRNPRKLWKRNCMKCNTEIQTTYSPERKEMVYCEKCYLQAVY